MSTRRTDDDFANEIDAHLALEIERLIDEGKTPEEARVRLLRIPFEPRSDLYSLFTPYLADDRNEAWRTYLFLGRN